jgi:predicted ATPase
MSISLGGRYVVRRELGRGSMGVVYEAYDTTTRASVALKTIATDEAAAERLYRLKQEFRVVADLQHPNLVRFGELASHEGQWFFTMELVQGGSFVEHVRPTRANTGLDEPRLRSALVQLVAALSAIHGAGLVHRDVKPSNVLVDAKGRVAVLDFGLMVARTHAANEDAASGTPDYMAPEQIEGLAAGPAADWYAVGTMLFVGLTGRVPFRGDAMEVMQNKLTRAAPAPHDVAPGVPPDLDSLCADLLRADPTARPGEAEIRARLGMPAHTGNALDSGAFVGREAELAAMKRAQGEVSGGRARTVVIEGEPGIGKSALVARFVSSLGPGTLVLAGRSYEQESVPFKGIDAVVDALSEHLLALPERDAKALLGGGVRFLATVFPVLNRVPLVAEVTSKARILDNPRVLREQAFGEFERLLAALAKKGRVVLFLDDIQWADRESLALVSALLHADPPIPFLFLATMRTGVDLPRGAMELAAGALRLPLAGLSDREAEALCEDLWQAEDRRDSQEPAALAKEAGGHPLYLAELVRSARRGGPQRSGRMSLQDVLWERIAERDPIERRFLEVLAVAGAPLPFPIVARAAQVDVGECQNRLGALRAAQLVRISRRGDERSVVPYHDRVRESVLLHRTGGEQAALRDQLSLGRALLEATPEDALAGRVFAIVRHFHAARDLVLERAERLRVAELDLLAAREAMMATAYEAARDYASSGLAFLEESGWSAHYATARDLLVERMRAEFLTGDAPRARASFAEAQERISTTHDRTELFVAWIDLASAHGRFDEALEAGRARLRELRVRCPRRVTVLGLLWQYLATRRVQAGRTPDALRSLPVSSDPLRQSAMKVLMAITPAAYWVSSNLAGWISLELARMSMRHGVSDVSSYGFATYGVILEGAFGKLSEAAAFGQLALALNERVRNESLGAKLYLLNGQFLTPWVQPLADARKVLRTAYNIATKLGDTVYETYAACSLSHLSFIESRDLGAHAEVTAWAQEVCERLKDRNMAGSVASHWRYLATLRGEIPVEATAELPPGFSARVGDRETSPSAYDAHWESSTWIAYLFGDAQTAAACLAAGRGLEQAHLGHPTSIDLCFLDCVVAAKLHDTAPWPKRLALRWKMARCVRKLRAWASSSPWNFEPHYLIARAEWARVKGDWKEADACLTRAAEGMRTRGGGVREGLALELAAANAEKRGEARAGELRDAARAAYRKCGAEAKAMALAGHEDRVRPLSG